MSTVSSRSLVHLLQGLLMGAADVVPGVSGGTVALVVGIYARLVSSIRAAAAVPVALLRGRTTEARERLAEAEWRLVVPLGVGILVAIGVGSVVIPPLRERFPAGTSAVFLGLIVASLVLPWRQIGHRGADRLVLMAAAAVVAFVLAGLPVEVTTDPSLPRVGASAAVAICAMILPGVSGAYLLEVLGVYTPTLEALRALDVAYIATFALGAAGGLGLFAKTLESLLVRAPDRTMAVLTGLMLGALRALWPWLDADRGMLAPPDAGAALTAGALAAGSFLALRLGLWLAVRVARRQRVPSPD